MYWHPTPTQVIIHRSKGGRFEKIKKPSKNGHVKFNHLHMHQGSPRSFLFLAHCCATSTVISLLPKANFARTIQPNFHPTIQRNLCLPHTCPSLTCAIGTLLPIWWSSILSTNYPNRLNTVGSLYSSAPFVFQLLYAHFHYYYYYYYYSKRLAVEGLERAINTLSVRRPDHHKTKQ